MKKDYDSIEKVKRAWGAVIDKKALEPICVDIRGLTTIADYFLICSGSSSRQVDAIADEIERRLRKLGEKGYHIEGQSGGQWVLMDFGDLIVHVFHEEAREHYDLERLWGDAPRIEFDEEALVAEKVG